MPAFLAPVSLSSGATALPGSYAVAAGDLNADGWSDLAVVNLNDTYTTGTNSSMAVMLNKADGSGGFQPARTYPLSYIGRAVGIADINGDGRPDIVTAGDRYVTVFTNQRNGTFKAGPNLTLPSVNADPSSQFANSLAVGDFNNDGKADIAVTARVHFPGGQARGYTHILQGSGTGTFTVTSTTAISPMLTQSDPWMIGTPAFTWTSVGDFNHDGKLDVLASVQWGYAPMGTYLLMGNGDGTLRPPVAVGETGWVSVGDFNGDGKLDILVTSTRGGSVYFLGNGNGTFQTGRTLSVNSLYGAVVADFNHDGRLDLVTLYYNLYLSLTNGIWA